ncbi:PAS domain S-box-containing protein [Chitinophaga sp. CF118]|uniref:PAS domain S-box protein n=1 Tax=Chitinophaga sp. CF118 TaxID=1884367 RepID=UPI0008F1280E|nr:PAS domain S-box protein [Chitinophaga sp. CF118]SFF09988.1 PAS domain S-box-containing protein [Chitinophaga sp. CF118]
MYHELMENLPVAIYTTDANGYVSSYNQEAVMLWGREPEIGKELWCGSWKIYNTDGSLLPLDNCPMAIILKGGKTEGASRIIIERPNGTRRYVKPYPSLFYDEQGKVAGAINMLIDLTDLLESEQALYENHQRLEVLTTNLENKAGESAAEMAQKSYQLKNSEERYHKMVDEVEDYAIIMIDQDGFIQNWNKGAEKIKGYKEAEILGKHFRIFYLQEDQQKKVPERLIQSARKMGRSDYEGWRVRKNGTTFWGSIVLTALHDEQGEVIGFTKVTRDLTERKTFEDKLKQYTRELETRNAELQQFAYAVAHDMKEPLRKISYYTSAISGGAGRLLPVKEKNYLERSANAAIRMQTFIEDLLAYTWVSGKASCFEQVNLNIILEEALVLHEETIKQTNAVIETCLLPVISGIPFQMRQLMNNLIGNALKYHHPEHVPYIQISYNNTDNVLSSENNGIDNLKRYHIITIQDNGIGFEPEYGEKIFEIFERLHGKEFYPGTGIGLALCRKIAENHKGLIKAQGMPGQGAVFIIYLPR